MRKSSGRPAKLDQKAKQKLLQELEKGAPAAGFPTEQWTQARVKKVIEREFGGSTHQNYIYLRRSSTVIGSVSAIVPSVTFSFE